jgi:hypothetical protein
MKVFTENSIYEFDVDNMLVRRLPKSPTAPLPKDGEWHRYLTAHPEVGESMRIVMEHLAGEEGSVTLRTTSTVVRVEE